MSLWSSFLRMRDGTVSGILFSRPSATSPYARGWRKSSPSRPRSPVRRWSRSCSGWSGCGSHGLYHQAHSHTVGHTGEENQDGWHRKPSQDSGLTAQSRWRIDSQFKTAGWQPKSRWRIDSPINMVDWLPNQDGGLKFDSPIKMADWQPNEDGGLTAQSRWMSDSPMKKAGWQVNDSSFKIADWRQTKMDNWQPIQDGGLTAHSRCRIDA